MVQLFIEDVLKSNLMPMGEMVHLFYRGLNSSKGDHTGNVENLQAYVNLNSQLVKTYFTCFCFVNKIYMIFTSFVDSVNLLEIGIYRILWKSYI